MKKNLCVLLVLSLVLVASVPAFGAADSNSLEKAILKAKSIVYVSPSLTGFSYNFSEYDGRTSYSLNWHDNEYKNSIFAEVIGDYLTSYSKASEEQNNGLGSVSRETALASAKAFLAKNNPTLAAKMKETDNRYRNTNFHYFYFKLEEGGKPVDFVRANVTVNSHTGEVTGYNWEGLANQYIYPSDSNVITEKAAMDAYLSYGGIKLEYGSWYDYEKQELKIIPKYALDSNFGISANNGKKVILYYNSIAPMNATAAGESAKSAMDMGLSEAELGEVDNLSNMLSKESALAALTKFFPVAGLKLNNSSLRNIYDDKDEYLWNFSFVTNDNNSSAHAAVNAKSGEIYSWSYYKYKESTGDPKISKAAGLKIAKEALQKLSPSKSASVKLNEPENDVLADVKIPAPLPYTSSHSYNFIRQVSGIPFSTDYISVNVDTVTGDIISYNCNWHANAKFPELKNIIPLSKAVEVYAEKLGFGLWYGIPENIVDVSDISFKSAEPMKNSPVLLYSMLGADGFSVDPFTGKLIYSYDGKDYEETFLPQYSDLGNHWAKDTVSILLDNGYYIKEKDFQPNVPITQEAFFRYLYANSGSTQDQLYDTLKWSGVILDGERNPQVELSRYEAAKFIVRYLKEQKLAAHPEVFVNLFNDEISSEYKGYAAIVKALSIMKGDQEGNFNGAKVLSRGEAAALVYNTLQVSMQSDFAPDTAVPVPYLSGVARSASGGGSSASFIGGVGFGSIPSAAPVN